MLYHTILIESPAAMSAVLKTDTDAVTGSTLDRAGICVSTLCLVQCLILPILVVASPLTSLGVFGHEAFHVVLLVLIVPISLVAFALGYRIHRNRAMLIPGLIGLAIVAVATLFGHELLSPLGTALITSMGGLLLIAGHWLNLRQRRQTCLQPRV